MRTRTTLAAAAMLAAGALLGWLAASGRLAIIVAQEKKPAADVPRDVLPIPQPPFEGKIGRTAKESTPDFPNAGYLIMGSSSRNKFFWQPTRFTAFLSWIHTHSSLAIMISSPEQVARASDLAKS